MKDTLKFILVALFGAAGALVPLYLAFSVWSWVMTQVPVGEWAGLIKIGITLLLIGVGGGVTVGMAIFIGGLGAALAAWITGLLD